MHVAWRGRFRPHGTRPRPTLEALRASVASRVSRCRRFRQRLAYPPLGLGEPYWMDDARFDIRAHVTSLSGVRRPGHAPPLREPLRCVPVSPARARSPAVAGPARTGAHRRLGRSALQDAPRDGRRQVGARARAPAARRDARPGARAERRVAARARARHRAARPRLARRDRRRPAARRPRAGAALALAGPQQRESRRHPPPHRAGGLRRRPAPGAGLVRERPDRAAPDPAHPQRAGRRAGGGQATRGSDAQRRLPGGGGRSDAPPRPQAG